MKNRSTVQRALVALVLGLAMSLIPGRSPAASASVSDKPPCYGSGCIGKSPTISLNGLSCADDAKTVGQVAIGGNDPTQNGPELRWSANCAANWARTPGGQQDIFHAYSYWAETSDGRKSSIGSSSSGPYFTTMVNGLLSARVCVRYYSAGVQFTNCSGWH